MIPRPFLMLLLMAVSISACEQQDKVIINKNVVSVEIADEPQEHTIGLMHRASLDKDAGMLFIFDDEQVRTFWMKNTKIPLDMIFISEDKKIIDIQEAEPCTEDPCTFYTSKEKAQYVLEVNRGYTKTKNIKRGDAIVIKRK